MIIRANMIPALLNQSSYMTPDQATRAVVRDLKGAESEFKSNPATDYAEAMKSEALWAFETSTGLKLREKEFEFGGISTGNILVVDGMSHGVKIRTPYGFRDKEEPEFLSIHDDENFRYYMEIMIQMYVANLDAFEFFQWAPEGMRSETVPYDEDEALSLIEQSEVIVRRLKDELNEKSHLEPLRKEYDSKEAQMLVDELDQLQNAVDNANERIGEIKAEMIKIAKDESAIVGGRKVTKVVSKGNVSWKAVAQDLMPKDFDTKPFTGSGKTSWRIG